MTLTRMMLVLMLLPAPVFAQYGDSYGGSFNNPISSSLSSAIWGNLQSQMNLQMQRSLMQSSARGRRPASPTPVASTTFRPGTGPVAPKTLARTVTDDPRKQAEYEQLFLSCLRIYREAGAKIAGSGEKGLNADVAGGLAYFVAINYYVCAQNDPSLPQDITDVQYAALVRRVRTFLAGQDSFTSLSNRDRQAFHETLVITATLPLVAQIEATRQKDRAGLDNAVRLARENLARVGATPERLRFTDDGVEVR